jgi:uncharacterized protein YeeX (DUF496 family)
MTEYLTDNYDAQSRLFQVVKDMELMGADIGEIEDTVSIRFKNKKRVNAIMNGEYIAPNISEARIESIIERLYDENPVNAARVEDEFLTATDIFEDMRMDLEAIELGEGPESFRETINFTLNPPSVQNQETPGVTGIESVAEVELPLPVGIGTPVNASLFANNNNLGNQFNLLPNNVKFDKLFPQG